MNFTLHILPRALADMRSAMRWIATNVSPASAFSWNTRAQTAIRNVLADPGRHRLAHEADDLGIELREALFGRKPNVYRLLFSIEGSTMVIHFVRHAAAVGSVRAICERPSEPAPPAPFPKPRPR